MGQVHEELKIGIGSKVYSTNPRAYNLPSASKITAKKQQTLPPHAQSTVIEAPPKVLNKENAIRAKIMGLKVQTTAAYQSRIMHSERNQIEGIGCVIAIHDFGEGFVADVMWDNGKMLQGYCVGFRGLYDLQLAPKVTTDGGNSAYSGSKRDNSVQCSIRKRSISSPPSLRQQSHIPSPVVFEDSHDADIKVSPPCEREQTDRGRRCVAMTGRLRNGQARASLRVVIRL